MVGKAKLPPQSLQQVKALLHYRSFTSMRIILHQLFLFLRVTKHTTQEIRTIFDRSQAMKIWNYVKNWKCTNSTVIIYKITTIRPVYFSPSEESHLTNLEGSFRQRTCLCGRYCEAVWNVGDNFRKQPTQVT